MEGALDRKRVSVDEILSEIRTMGYEHFNQIKWVVLEPDGKISCIPKDLNREGSYREPSRSEIQIKFLDHLVPDFHFPKHRLAE